MNKAPVSHFSWQVDETWLYLCSCGIVFCSSCHSSKDHYLQDTLTKESLLKGKDQFDLLLLTSLEQLFLILKLCFYFFAKQPTLMRRSIVLSLPLQWGFLVLIKRGTSCTFNLLAVTSLGHQVFFIENIFYQSFKTSYLNEEFNCTKPFLSLSVPGFGSGYKRLDNDIDFCCLLAKCLLTKCLLAKCLLAKCLYAKCLLAKCL